MSDTEVPWNASVLIVNDAGEYLLHLRDHIPGIWEPGAWSLLGGGRTPGDRSLEETARRELMEEAGLDLPVLEPFQVEHATGADGLTVSIQVFAGRWNGDPDALRLTEGVMLRWFAPEIMPRLRMSPSTLDLVRRHVAQRSGAQATTDRGTVPNVIGVHLYLENEHGAVLLGLRHPDCAYAGRTWHFLAGHCERESAITGVVREAREEGGLLIRPEDVELVHVVHMSNGPGRQPRMQMIFRARSWEGEPEVREPDKCLAWRWWDPRDLPDNVVPYTRTAIEGIRAGRLYTEMGWV
ncbi:NUDIX domain-containing protein [Streptomyces sp. NPDC046862]|uniref:NUDIX hydrolase n=1 Tax=Streptomyces sp. NPDC046862 TaxID=3154603 RepID=UPI0034558F41